MTGKPVKHYWLIRGYDGTSPIFERKVTLGQFSQEQIKRLLQALAAKVGLTMDETLGAYAKRRTKISNSLLHVYSDFPTFTCGESPFFVATIVDERGKPVPKAKWR